jgi:hypothetical protein
MTYSELLTAIYSHFDSLRNSPLPGTEMEGAFVFLPEWYIDSGDFELVHFEFWPVPTIRQFLLAGGQTDEGLMDLLAEVESEEEFLAMIVEKEEGTSLRKVHIHKIAKLGLN